MLLRNPTIFAKIRSGNLNARSPRVRALLLAAASSALLTRHSVQAATTQYWDTSTVAGYQAGNGDWGTSSDWTTDGTTLATWGGGANSAVFNGSGISQVTVNSAVSAAAVHLGDTPASGTNSTVFFSGNSTLTDNSYFGVGWQTAGDASTASDTFIQTGGTINVTASGLIMGRFGTAGSYYMTGGNLTTPNAVSSIRLGNAVTSGSPTGNSSGVFVINGGTVNAGASSTILLGTSGSSGSVGSGVLALNSGSLTAGTLTLSAANTTFTTGTVNLNGGTMTLSLINTTAIGSSIFNFNGGTLLPSGNGAFMTGLTNAYVYAGGVVIDTTNATGNNTISQNLLAAPGGGYGLSMTSLTPSNAGSGYLSAPTVTFSAPTSGTTATGYAVLNSNGTLNSIVITNPGSGYASSATVTATISGGGGTGATFSSPTASASQSVGGLTKLGVNTLILSGANTYAGSTTVSAGLLRINGNNSAATGAVNVSAGSIGGTGTIGGAVTLSGTGGINLRDGAVGTLTLGSTLNITGAAGANNLYFDLGNNTATTDKLVVTGATTMTTSGAAVINLNELGGVGSPVLTSGSPYTLIQGTGTIPALANFTLASTKAYGQTFSLSESGNNLQLSVQAGTAGPAAAWWAGGTDANWTTAANWNTTATSGTSSGVPGYQTNVNFYTTTPAAQRLTTNTLSADQDINSLNFAATATTAVTIAGSNTLTIEATNANSNTAGNGITVNTPSSGTVTHTISANVGLAASQTWTVNASATLAVSGNITDFGGGYTLTKAGAGTLVLSGANSYSGGTTLSAGTLQLSGGTNRLLSTGSASFAGNSTLDVGSTSQTLAALSVNDGVTGTVNGSAGSLTITGNSFALGGIVNSDNQTLSMSGLATFNYSNTGGTFRVSGQNSVFGTGGASGTLALASANSITASVFGIGDYASSQNNTVNTGTVSLGTTNTINADTITVGGSRGAGTLQYASVNNPTLTIFGSNGTGRAATVNVGISVGPNVSNQQGTVDLISNVSGTSTLNALIGTLDIGVNSRGADAGVNPLNIAGTFAMGGGTLDATNIYIGQNLAGFTTSGTTSTTTGTFTVSAGTVKVSNLYLADQQVSATDPITATFNLNSGATLQATFIGNGTGTGTGGATRTFNWSNGTIQNYRANATLGETETNLTIGAGPTWNLASTGTHAFDIDTGYTGTVNATLADATSGGTLVKIGGGSLSLTAANSYTGSTTINSGALQVDGSLASGSAVTVGGSSASGTPFLTGKGTVNGTVSLASAGGGAAGNISPGTVGGIGKLTTGAETWNSGATYQWDIGSSAGTLASGVNGTPGTTYDDLVATAGLTVPTAGMVTIAPTGSLTGITAGTTYTWVLAQINTLSVGGAGVTASGTPISSDFTLNTSGLNASINGGTSTTAAGTFSLFFEAETVPSSTNDLVLSYTAAPEPGAATLFAAGAGSLLMRRRRRQRAYDISVLL
jgi:autotransporter-associated beta strand protein